MTALSLSPVDDLLATRRIGRARLSLRANALSASEQAKAAARLAPCVTQGMLLQVLRLGAPVTALSLSPAGDLLATAHVNPFGRLHLWATI